MPKKFQQFISFAVALLFAISTAAFPACPVRASTCPDVEFIFARGSGEPLDGPSFSAWRDSILNAISDLSITADFYELGSAAHGGYRYPAITVSVGEPGGLGNLLGAYISRSSAGDFSASVEQGKGELLNYIAEVSVVCSGTKFVLGGYSQGAMIISWALPYLEPDGIIYAATFGDPKLYLPEGATSLTARVPDACHLKNLSDYRADVPDCYAYEGVLGSYRPYRPAELQGKLGTWCNNHDIMCSSFMSLDDHIGYKSAGLYTEAAAIIAGKLRQAFPPSSEGGSLSLPLADFRDFQIAILRTNQYYRDPTNPATAHAADLVAEHSAEFNSAFYGRALEVGAQFGMDSYDLDPSSGISQYRYCDFTEDCHSRMESVFYLFSDAPGPTDLTVPLANILSDARWDKLAWSAGQQKVIVIPILSGKMTLDSASLNLPDDVRVILVVDAVHQDYYEALAAPLGIKVFTYSDTPDQVLQYVYDGTESSTSSSSPASTAQRAPSSFVSPGNRATISALSGSLDLDIDSLGVTFASTAARILVILDGAILGWLNPGSESALWVSDLTSASVSSPISTYSARLAPSPEPLELTLVPYATGGRRGQPATLLLDFDTGEIVVTGVVPVSSVQNSATPGTNTSSGASSPASASASIMVPLAPNTGAKS